MTVVFSWSRMAHLAVSKPYDIFVNASEKAVSGILTQQDAKKQYAPLLSSVKNLLMGNENGLL